MVNNGTPVRAVQFGAVFKIEGNRASSAAAKLLEQAEQAGQSNAMIPPPYVNGDVFVVTEQDAEAYEAIKQDSMARFPALLAEKGIDPSVLAKLQDPQAELPAEVLTAIQQISSQLLEAAKPNIRALLANAQVLQADQVLSR